MHYFCSLEFVFEIAMGPLFVASAGFFKENVRYLVWMDPISLILGTRFSNLGTRIEPLKHLKIP